MQFAAMEGRDGPRAYLLQDHGACLCVVLCSAGGGDVLAFEVEAFRAGARRATSTVSPFAAASMPAWIVGRPTGT